MRDFHRKLLQARLEGHASELGFWADYAEDRQYRGAERLRALAASATSSPPVLRGPCRATGGGHNA